MEARFPAREREPDPVGPMDPQHSAEAERFRDQVRAFLGENLPPEWQGLGAIADRDEADAFVQTWRDTLAANGLVAVSWPKEYGGAGLSKVEQVVLVEELARAGVPAMGYNDTFSIKMLGGTLLRWGTEDQKRRFLPRILSGEDRWCQGFSEPGSGSDLASLTTRAVLDGDRWVIEGQKLWTSRGTRSQLDLPSRSHQPRCAEAPRHLVPPRPARPTGHRHPADTGSLR